MPKHIIDTGNQSLSGGLTLTGELSAQTVSINSSALVAEGTTWTYGTGAADTHLTALGGGTAGKEIFGAATYTGTGSVRKLAGLDTTDSPTFSSISCANSCSIPINNIGKNIIIDDNSILRVNGVFEAWSNEGLNIYVGKGVFFANGSGFNPTREAGFSRLSQGLIGVNNGTAGNTSGSLSLTNLTASGTVSANTLSVTDTSTTLTNLGVTGTGVQSALAAATNATGGLVTFGGNIGAATGTSLKIPTIICDSGLLEIKDSTTWQNLRIFSTTNNGSNFEYFTIAQSGAAWKISGGRSGTGPTRQLQIQPLGSLQLGANGGDGWSINITKHLYPDGTTQSRDLGLVGNRIRTLYGQNADLTGNLTASGTVSAADLALTEKSADPADPAEGKSVIWQSDGTGSGDDGDIMIKITAGGVTKTGTIIDFSTL